MQVELVITVFEPTPEGKKRRPQGYVKRFRGDTLEQAKDTTTAWLDAHTPPGTRVIELTAHYVGGDTDEPLPV
jgi:hypothetical protein